MQFTKIIFNGLVGSKDNKVINIGWNGKNWVDEAGHIFREDEKGNLVSKKHGEARRTPRFWAFLTLINE